jgi:hypothetical protein
MADHSLDDPFDAIGEWFIPQNPDRRVGGTLSYNADRTQLKLNDRLQPLQGTTTFTIGDPIQQYPIVQGVSTQGEAITVFDAWQDGFQINSSSGGVRMPESLISYMAVVGGYVTSDEKFAEMRCRIPGLEAWLSNRSIQVTAHDKGFTLNVGEQPDEVTPVPECDLKWSVSSRSSLDTHAASIKTHGYVQLLPSEPRQLSWYFEQLQKITSLLTLLAGHQMPADQMTVPIGTLGQRASVLVNRMRAVSCPYTQEREFFLPRSKLENNFGPLVASWFSKYSKLQVPCHLALSVMQSGQPWTNVEFLSLMQALEGLHRSLYDGTYMAASDYERVRDTLSKAIPSEVSPSHRSALLSKIRYGNELSLASRIRGLLGTLPLSIRTRVLGNDGGLPRAWIDTRNYYTHWDEALMPGILSLGEMHNAGVHLKQLLRVLYLHLVGVSEYTLLTALSNTSHASLHLSQLNAREKRKT